MIALLELLCYLTNDLDTVVERVPSILVGAVSLTVDGAHSVVPTDEADAERAAVYHVTHGIVGTSVPLYDGQ